MNQQIFEEATEWLIKHREGELAPQEKAQFDAWLRESPQHVRAYLEMSAIWEDVPALDAGWNPTAEELIANAAGESNVLPLTAAAPRAADVQRASPAMDASPAMEEGGPRRAARARSFALVAGLLIAIVAGASWYGLSRNTYATDIGEQRSIMLTDGSSVELNSRSRVRIRYTDARRDVDLLEGQALFRVAHNRARPFVVHSGTTSIRAVGTQFDVYRKRAATVVTVIDGKVEVLAGAPPSTTSSAPGATPLRAGEQLTVPVERSLQTTDAPAHVQPQPANVATAIAWTQHNLVFESAPLNEVAEEFNRYTRRPLVITDSGIASMRISGMFSSADPELLLKFLRAQPELVIEETDREIRINKR
jgi:transmembrane sensor